MCLNAINTIDRQQGFALPAAIFVITVLALIAAAMGRLRETSAIGYGHSINSTRAFYAAESGAQIGVYKTLIAASCISETLSPAAFAQCSVTTSCNSNASIYTLRSTAVCGSGIDAAIRSIEVRFR